MQELNALEAKELLEKLQDNLSMILWDSSYFHLIIAEEESTIIITKQEKSAVVSVYEVPVCDPYKQNKEADCNLDAENEETKNA